jgi:hypothetical protein
MKIGRSCASPPAYNLPFYFAQVLNLRGNPGTIG